MIVEWYLYLTERQDKYQALTEPRTDGFWSEDLPVPSNQGNLQLDASRTHEGRIYLAAPLMRRALFPLQSGTLTITPLEAEISPGRLLRAIVRNQRLKAEPLAIEVDAAARGGQAGRTSTRRRWASWRWRRRWTASRWRWATR